MRNRSRVTDIKPLSVGIRQAAEMLGVSPWTIREWVRRGYLPTVRIGRRVLLTVASLEEVLEASKVECVCDRIPGRSGAEGGVL